MSRPKGKIATLRSSLGNRIRAAREAKGWSLRHLASEVYLSPSYLSKVERGVAASLPEERTLRAMGSVLGIDGDEMCHLASRVPQDVVELILASQDAVERIRKILRGSDMESTV